MKYKKHLIVFNPQTGKKGNYYLVKLKKELECKKIPYDVFHTEADTLSSENKINKKLGNYSDVVAIGGDGTLNMLSNVLAFKNIPLAIIPCGTGNDFARHIYTKTDDVIAAVINNKIMTIDLGWCNDRYFINVLGVGYDAMIAEKTKDENKTLFRSLFYLWNALKYLPFYKERNLQIKSEYFNKSDATFMAAFGNGTFFGNGMNITPKADITDGLLDCCWVGQLGFVRKCYCLLKLFSGKHLSVDNIEYVQDKQFQVLSKNHPIEADGEFIGYSPATIRIAERALVLKVP